MIFLIQYSKNILEKVLVVETEYVSGRLGKREYLCDSETKRAREDKLMSLPVFYEPLMTWKFIPLIDSKKATDLWAKMKK
jgi:hypothetical protein